jgi:hypothetical protein
MAVGKLLFQDLPEREDSRSIASELALFSKDQHDLQCFPLKPPARAESALNALGGGMPVSLGVKVTTLDGPVARCRAMSLAFPA